MCAAPKGNKFAEGQGRPTKYKSEYDQQVYKLCLLGATDKEIADFFEVNEDTITEWKKQFESFSVSLKEGKESADMIIAESLHNRAKGATIIKQQAFKVKKHKVVGDKVVADEVLEVIDLEEQVPPDTTAIIFWLKNRKTSKWRDKQDVELSNPDGTLNQLPSIKLELSTETLEKIKKNG